MPREKPFNDDASEPETSWAIRINPPDSDVNTLRRKLREDNIAQVGHDEEEIELAILLHYSDGELAAGISGSLWGSCLEIDYLWVEENMRGQGSAPSWYKRLNEPRQSVVARRSLPTHSASRHLVSTPTWVMLFWGSWMGMGSGTRNSS